MEKEDCLPCRLSGGAIGLGTGYFSFRKAMQLQKTGAGNPNKAVAFGVAGVSKFYPNKVKGISIWGTTF
jgi:hypothetical protein